MFTGIVEATGTVRSFLPQGANYQLSIERPSSFDDIALGDSIAHDGICLTVEAFDQDVMTFTLGAETLRITRADQRFHAGSVLNLERSLRFGDRVHGHLVSGHIDALGTVHSLKGDGTWLELQVKFPSAIMPLVWPKGSIAINGVSLTVNAITQHILSVGLIPETLKRTNLSLLRVGDFVNLETDQFARGLLRLKELGK